ncbi:MAG: nucleoside-diphosphate kinase [Candidatus Methylomirabilales bacterium]
MERTLAIVKPDAVARGKIGEIIHRFEEAGLQVCGLRMVHLEKREAEQFYHVHRGRPFFESLATFMSSGPSVVMVLEGKSAITTVRAIMGATDPAQASPGSIRRDLATSIEQNAVHGSDSPESAAFEVPYFFTGVEIFDYTRVDLLDRKGDVNP